MSVPTATVLMSCVAGLAGMAVSPTVMAVESLPPDAEVIPAQVIEVSQAPVALFEAAIDEGVPLFNDGDPAACAQRYREGVSAALELSDEDLTEWHRWWITSTLEGLDDDPTSQAWQLRRLMDATIADIQFEPTREANLPLDFPEVGPIGRVQVKTYPTYRMATSTGRRAFMNLFNHIQGASIPMTAPVEMARDEAGDGMFMGFMYEAPDQGTTGAHGPNVEVVDIPAQTVISIALRGNRNNQVLETARALIQAYAEENAIPLGERWRLFGYSSPMIARNRQYYELQVPVLTAANEAEADAEPTQPLGDAF